MPVAGGELLRGPCNEHHHLCRLNGFNGILFTRARTNKIYFIPISYIVYNRIICMKYKIKQKNNIITNNHCTLFFSNGLICDEENIHNEVLSCFICAYFISLYSTYTHSPFSLHNLFAPTYSSAVGIFFFFSLYIFFFCFFLFWFADLTRGKWTQT